MLKRKSLILIAVLSLALILMAGTFAWQQMVSKVNEFIGHTTGITVHDDFDPDTGVKEVYAENPSSTEVFVRMKLEEVMDLTSNATIDSGWIPHIYGGTNGEDCGHANGAGELFHDYFTWSMGGQKYYMPVSGTQQVVQDTTIYNSGDAGVKLTPYADIIKAKDYIDMDPANQRTFYGWIYDTDGYAYWSQPLGHGDVTGLLLNHVTTNGSIIGTDYYYAINVIAEAVDSRDIPMWTQGIPSLDNTGTTYPQATSDGVEVINSILALSASATPAP